MKLKIKKLKSKSFIKNFNFITNILILLVFIVGGLSYADSNGVWTYASDITGGIFGFNQQTSNMFYSFINPVYFYNSLVGYSNNSVTSGLLANGISGYSSNFHGSAVYGLGKNGAYSGYFENGPFEINLGNGKNLTYKNGVLTVSGGNVYVNNKKVAIEPIVCTGSKQVLQWNGSSWSCYKY